MKWTDNTDLLHKHMLALSIRDADGQETDRDAAFARWRQATMEIRDDKGTVYLVGNGASASMASHLAADLAKNAHVHTQVFSDLSLLTSIANDLCYDEVFAEPLRRRMTNRDMLVAISSSGQSANVLRAVEEARYLGGKVVTLSAMAAGNSLREMGTLNFYVPATTYGMAETCHAAILHYWMDMVSVAANGKNGATGAEILHKGLS